MNTVSLRPAGLRQRSDLHDQLKQAASSWANVKAASTLYMRPLPWVGTGGRGTVPGRAASAVCGLGLVGPLARAVPVVAQAVTVARWPSARLAGARAARH